MFLRFFRVPFSHENYSFTVCNTDRKIIISRKKKKKSDEKKRTTTVTLRNVGVHGMDIG